MKTMCIMRDGRKEDVDTYESVKEGGLLWGRAWRADGERIETVDRVRDQETGELLGPLPFVVFEL